MDSKKLICVQPCTFLFSQKRFTHSLYVQNYIFSYFYIKRLENVNKTRVGGFLNLNSLILWQRNGCHWLMTFNQTNHNDVRLTIKVTLDDSMSSWLYIIEIVEKWNVVLTVYYTHNRGHTLSIELQEFSNVRLQCPSVERASLEPFSMVRRNPCFWHCHGRHQLILGWPSLQRAHCAFYTPSMYFRGSPYTD